MELLLKTIHERIAQEAVITDWVFIDQMQVDIFGKVTRWYNQGHNDPEWAARHSPHGGTLLHGFFMMSLITHFLKIGGFYYKDGKHPLNYGVDKARILRPVLVRNGVKLRDRISIMDIIDKGHSCRLIKTAHQIETDEYDQPPAAYIEYLNLWHPK